jgi:hypothetical protein
VKRVYEETRTYTPTCKTLCCWTPLRPNACIDPKQPLCGAESVLHAYGYLKKTRVADDHESQDEARTPQQCSGRDRPIEKSIRPLGHSAIDQCGDFWCGDKKIQPVKFRTPNKKWLKPSTLGCITAVSPRCGSRRAMRA